MSIDSNLQHEARNILMSNDRGGYTVPNPSVYPFQWNWDSLFVALGWLTFDEPRAWQEIEMLFTGQWDNGLVPSIVFHHYSPEYFPGPDVWQAKSKHNKDTTGITQIPIVVMGTELMYRLAKDTTLAQEKMATLFNELFLYQQWFYINRRYKDTGLCQIFHGWEAMDNSPMWDKALEKVTPTSALFERKDKQNIPEGQRPTQWDYERYISIVEKMKQVEYDSIEYQKVTEMAILDAALNGVLIAGNQALLRLVDQFGTPTQAQQLEQWQKETTRDMRLLWNETLGIYVDFDVIAETAIGERISGAFIPLLAGVTGENPEQYRTALQRWISQDMPSVDCESEVFEAMRYWRGPSWSIMNFMIYCGCLLVGWHQEAQEIKARSLQQILTGGFYENFNPLNREGGGGTDFSWTAATYLYWLDETDTSFNFEPYFNSTL